jgi:hypothetical protein
MENIVLQAKGHMPLLEHGERLPSYVLDGQ